MKYNSYDTYDFLKDENFRRWVFEQNEIDDSFWKEWLGSNQERASKALLAREILTSIQYKKSDLDKSIKSEVLKGVFEGQRPSRFKEEKKAVFSRSFQQNYLRNIAAAFIALIFAFGIWFTSFQWSAESKETEIVKIIKKETEKGQKLNLSLADGSKIKLNADSRLSIPEKFSDSLRIVELNNGEAFFEIARNEQKPFIVKSQDVMVEVLGTAFNVNAYPDQEIISVAVTEGKVSVKTFDSTQQIHLLPGEVFYYNTKTGMTRKSTFNQEKLLAWKDGVLLFEDANIEEVISKLELWYGIEFKTKGAIVNKRKFNGRFDNESLKAILEALSFSSLLQYELKEKEVIISPIK